MRERYALDLKEAVKRATGLLSAMPEMRRVSLFGSYARGGGICLPTWTYSSSWKPNAVSWTCCGVFTAS